jgi:uncharacterized protein
MAQQQQHQPQHQQQQCPEDANIWYYKTPASDEVVKVPLMIYHMSQTLEKWSEQNKLPDDHGYPHWRKVFDHASKATDNVLTVVYKEIRYAPVFKSDYHLTDQQVNMILVASLLHDVDDPKIAKFVQQWAAEQKLDTTKRYPIAHHFLSDFPSNFIDGVIEMIGLVSCSINGIGIANMKENELWKFIPRDADRLTALGVTGAKRCYEVTVRLDNPLWTSKTPMATDDKSLAIIMKGRSLESYVQSGGKSASMIDHFYDKLLHLDQAASGNLHLQKEMDKEMSMLRAWLFLYCGFAKLIAIPPVGYIKPNGADFPKVFLTGQ